MLALTQSTVGGLKIDSAAVEGRYAAQAGDIVKLTVAGPDVKVEASGRFALDRTSASNVKYHVDAINLTELAKLAGQAGVGGTAILDGTITGNAASLQAKGTLNGSNLSYEDTKALDLNSQYTITVPDLTFAKAHVQATSDATFVAVAGMQLNSVKATTTYQEQRLDFTTHIQEKTRELDATGQLLLHRGSPGSPPAAARGPYPGGRVAHGPRQQRDRQVRPRAPRARERQPGQRRSGARRQRHARRRRRQALGRHRRPRAQRGHPAAGDAAPAEPRLLRQADRGREDQRLDGRARHRGAIFGRQGGVPVLSLRLAGRDRGLPGHADRDRRHAAAVADRVAHGARECADHGVHREGGRRSRGPGGGRADRPADHVHPDRPRPRAGPDRRRHQRHRHAANRRARDRIGGGSAPRRLHRHQGWRLRRAGSRGHLHGPDDPDRPAARPGADSAVPVAGSPRGEADDRRRARDPRGPGGCGQRHDRLRQLRAGGQRARRRPGADGAEGHRRAAPAARRRAT